MSECPSPVGHVVSKTTGECCWCGEQTAQPSRGPRATFVVTDEILDQRDTSASVGYALAPLLAARGGHACSAFLPKPWGRTCSWCGKQPPSQR